VQRLDDPEKRWKFSASDARERKFWGDYMMTFEDAICATASKRAPWYVVPVVVAAIVEVVGGARPHLPEGR
jgi:polyphosphate kinase 2 (PPK2 family)